MAERRRKQAPLPSRDKILEFIRESPTPVGKREIARAFGIKGADRIGLKAMLKELEREGDIDRGKHRKMASPGALDEVATLTVLGPDADGELLAAPADTSAEGKQPNGSWLLFKYLLFAEKLESIYEQQRAKDLEEKASPEGAPPRLPGLLQAPKLQHLGRWRHSQPSRR